MNLENVPNMYKCPLKTNIYKFIEVFKFLSQGMNSKLPKYKFIYIYIYIYYNNNNFFTQKISAKRKDKDKFCIDVCIDVCEYLVNVNLSNT